MKKQIFKIPTHLGIIIDGNRRWAKKRGLPSFEGHRRGLDRVNKIGEWCRKRGVKILTLYTFSTENWNRSKKEISYLMKLLGEALNRKNVKELHQKKIKLQVIGQKERLPRFLQQRIKKAEGLTQNNKEGILNLAISYGGRPEIVQAVKNIIEKKVLASKITEDLIDKNLWTADLPEPDLIIRTGGAQRLSNFLTWQSIYSELYFTKKHWPEFTEKDLDEALLDYSRRQRRFGR
ncbi:di-trans,poly-cis-decaprenylcistransferase [Patescibacteria group bacterium]|nr:di-trans,poly-cis-decaprenylcistransferase [Patescibacteria group bacterium]